MIDRPTTETSPADRARQAKYRRARIRNFLFTSGPNRLSGGRLARRHFEKNVRVRELEVASPRWPRAFDGLRVAHVSDFHLGELLPLDKALQVVERIAELEPDLVACTGDVVDLHYDEARPLLDAMAAVDAPLGTALVLGNHDELHCRETISRMAVESGVNVLHNQAMRINRNGDHFVLAGIDWAKAGSELARNVDEACGEEAHLLLAHNPRAFDRAAELAIPLTLAGHTHGGQIAMRRRPRANLALSHRYSAGLFESGDSRLFVTTGVGAWFPLRVNCPAEVAILTMRSDESPTRASVSDPRSHLVSRTPRKFA